MNTPTQIMQPEIVIKSNALARARWSAQSVWEPRLVALLASKIHKEDKDFQIYEVHASEIMRDDSAKAYRELEAVVDSVMSRVITIRDDEGWTKYNVFFRCRYRKKDNILELGFHPDLKPHYLNLNEYFTQYSLQEYLTLPSIYSQRIFEFLKSWDDRANIAIEINELYELLQVPKTLQRYPDFRRYVLERAHRDIQKCTSLRYEWEPIKKGRAIYQINFIFSRNKKAALEATRTSAEKEKESKENNDKFQAAVKCHESGQCKYKPRSRQCVICKKLYPDTDHG
jgi:plasmid replication initiation protein